jgi:hypothetical protein
MASRGPTAIGTAGRPVNRQVSDLIDDQQPRGRVKLELLVEAAFGERFGEGRRTPDFE